MVRPVHRQTEREPVHETTVVVMRARFGASRGETLVGLEREGVPEQRDAGDAAGGQSH